MLFGKPQGTCAHVSIGQVLLSVRCKKGNKGHAGEALCRAKFKFQGHQNFFCRREMVFTKFSCTDYPRWKVENHVVSDGVNAKLLGCHGPWADCLPGRPFGCMLLGPLLPFKDFLATSNSGSNS